MSEETFWDMPEEFKKDIDENNTGWSAWNPHKAICKDDGIGDCDGLLEFYWCQGEVIGYRCPKCGKEEFNPK